MKKIQIIADTFVNGGLVLSSAQILEVDDSLASLLVNSTKAVYADAVEPILNRTVDAKEAIKEFVVETNVNKKKGRK